MEKSLEGIGIQVVKTSVPKTCICPDCGIEQPVLRDREYLKKVKDLSLEKPTLLLVQRISVKCTNPDCPRKSFVLPTPGIERYQRVSRRVKEEALNKNILDNIPYYRTACSLRRLNTSGSKSSIDRWKQKETDQYGFKDIIHQMGFSGILGIDEYKPKRSRHYDLMAADAVKWRILYLESMPFSPSRAGTLPLGSIEQFCWDSKALEVNPWAIIKDHEIIPGLIECYRNTPVEAILIFKEQLHRLFNTSHSKADAYAMRDGLFKERWWQDSWHLRNIMEFLMSSRFDYMITYLGNHRIPRSGNMENLIAIWRQMEKVRYGFRTEKGRQNHLKLYQIKNYLKGNLAEKSRKFTTS